MALGGTGPVVVVLNPDHAAMLAAEGFDRPAAVARLAALAVRPRGELRAYYGDSMAGEGADSDPVPAIRDPEKVLLLVAGGPGMYSLVMPSWCVGAHMNPILRRRFEPRPFCAVPWLAESG